MARALMVFGVILFVAGLVGLGCFIGITGWVLVVDVALPFFRETGDAMVLIAPAALVALAIGLTCIWLAGAARR